MRIITRNYANQTTNLKACYSQYDMLIFCTGFISIVHTLIIIPQFIKVAAILLVLIWWFALRMKNKNFIVNRPLAQYIMWYGLFTVLVLVSYLYTVNTINASYAIVRVLFGFVVGLLVSDLVQDEKSFHILSSGLVSGGIVLVVSVLILEKIYIGHLRLGAISVGSGPTLSAIMLVSFSCSIWHFMRYSKWRKLYLVYSSIFYLIIVLSGSRRSMILAPLILLMLVFVNKEIKKAKKTITLISILCVCIFSLYFILTNETLYELVGWRIESMISSFLSSSGDLVDDSMRLRVIMKEYAMELFQQKPVWGYGVHGFAYMFMQSHRLLLYSHNGFTEILACYGIVGFLIFYRGFWLVFCKGIKNILHGSLHIQMLLIFSTVSLLTEMYTMAFLAPYVIVMLSACLSIKEE